ncbi:hypothetical protein [Pleomorphomonas carboxyditropha]|uniref:Beta/gamma crystallin 'Greek key' domain-containing protein n=1 Tax=Pleomorphomonas carboxyditropha TaxID=2023338 RepID=A0A2G9X2X4_9HYPH|nr:hypothetical protein [Pleomorphomonas carboxyditropha]PIP01320.1 hypothetical protein CJ014_04410 [Pleomorphomonas carboxyditropha]
MSGFGKIALSIGFCLSAGVALAQSASPYDMTYALREGKPTPLYADMSEKAARKSTIPGDAKGIVLRWCRDEIPFGSWQFGSRKAQLALLDARWCEISYNGAVGNVPGKVLTPQ